MLSKGHIFVFFFLIGIVSPTKAFAQSTSSATIRQDRLQTRQEIQQTRLTNKETLQDMRASAAAQLKQEREDFQAKLQDMRQTAQAAFQAQRLAFQEKVATIKDERKKQLIEDIQTKMTTVNSNRTSTMSANLDKLSSILETIQTQADAQKAAGKDVTSVTTAISQAQTAIQTAQTAVAAQAGKEYVITLTATGSGQLKNSVEITRKQFQTDMLSTYKLMLSAKQAVLQAAKALAVLTGITQLPITSTGSAAPVRQ